MIAVGYLLDTNVVSESIKPLPEPRVSRWLDEVDEGLVFLSVATVAEIQFGIERMPEGRRRAGVAAWLADELVPRFEDRLLPIDRQVAELWGVMMARGHRARTGLDAMDAFFAATAEARGLTLATRNVRHFASLGIALLDPWSGESST